MSHEKIQGRRRVFAEKVAEGHSATEAYLLAGYHAAKRETAHRAASRLYTQSEIRAYIHELRRAGDELARAETTLTIANKLAFLARLVLTGSTSLSENDPLIQSHRILKDGSLSIRMPCKLKALKMHSELAGHFSPDPRDQTIPIDPLQELFDQIRQGVALPEQPIPQTTRTPKTEHVPATTNGRCHDREGNLGRHNVTPAKSLAMRDTAAPSDPQMSDQARSFTAPPRGASADKYQESPCEPQQTTTTGLEPCPEGEPSEHKPLPPSPAALTSPPLHPLPSSPPRPVDVRRMVLAEIKKTDALHNRQPIPFYEEPLRPLVVLR